MKFDPADDNLDPDDDDQLDRLLAGYVNAELAGQRGKSQARFLGRLAFRSLRRRLLMAAAVLLAVGSIGLYHFSRPVELAVRTTQPAPAFEDAAAQPRVQAIIFDTTYDAGGAVVDGVPAQAYRREIVEQTERYDPRTHVTIATTIPRHEMVIETLEQY